MHNISREVTVWTKIPAAHAELSVSSFVFVQHGAQECHSALIDNIHVLRKTVVNSFVRQQTSGVMQEVE